MRIGIKEYIWELYGRLFIIKLADEFGNIIAQTDLIKIYKEPLLFNIFVLN